MCPASAVRPAGSASGEPRRGADVGEAVEVGHRLAQLAGAGVTEHRRNQAVEFVAEPPALLEDIGGGNSRIVPRGEPPAVGQRYLQLADGRRPSFLKIDCDFLALPDQSRITRGRLVVSPEICGVDPG